MAEESTAKFCLARLLVDELRVERLVARINEKIAEFEREPETRERILKQLTLAKQRQDLVMSLENYSHVVHLASSLGCKDSNKENNSSNNNDSEKRIAVIRNIQTLAQERRDRFREALDLVCELMDCYQE